MSITPNKLFQSVPLDFSKLRHELRTPVNHLLSYCDILLEEETIPAGIHSDLLKIHHGGRQLLSLINHYFDEKTFATLKLNTDQLFHELRTPANHIIGFAELIEEQSADTGCHRFVPDLQRINEVARTWLGLVEERLVPSAPSDEQSGSDWAVAGRMAGAAGFVASRDPVASLLVVDDDPANRELLRRRLQKEGYTVATAEGGVAALKTLRTDRFDLVLLDLMMPTLDGYQVLTRIKNDPGLKHLPVLMISALDQENGIARCIESGADDYVSKPFNPVFLRARIGAALERRRLRDLAARLGK